MRFVCLCVACLWCISTILAQDSLKTKELVGFTIQANRLTHFTSGNKIQKIDSVVLQRFQTNNLADLLSAHSQVFIKTYGQGSLATSSQRGTGASHTTVLWNGFNLQNPMNGNVDFALLPVFFLDKVAVQYGGGSAVFGSGAVGGAIHLNSSANFDEGLKAEVQLGAGSFGNYQQGIKLKISKKGFTSGLKIFNQTIENNFSFVNTAKFGKPTERQENNAFKQYGFLQENAFKINENQQLDLQIWYLNADRQIPPTLTTGASKASQQDESLRVTANWLYKKTAKATFLARSAFFKEKLIYQDPDIQLYALSKAVTWIGEAESKIQVRQNQLLNIGLNHTYFQAETDGYRAGKIQNRTALFASYKVSHKDWNFIGSIRKELIDSYFAPFTPSISWEGILSKHLIFKGNVARTYRVPTFNDLYWQSGGNPNLKPESGWTGEVSMEFLLHPTQKRGQGEKNSPFGGGQRRGASIQLTAFNSLISNWIAWLPNAQGRWEANNVLEVWSRGVEAVINYRIDIQKVRLQSSLSYNYVISTNEQVGLGNESSLHRQVIYVPKHTGQGTISMIYNGLNVSYTHLFTGERFTTSDNTQKLPFFSIGNVAIQQEIRRLTMQLQVNNIWNVSYLQIVFRPMPLQNFVVVMKYNWFKAKP